jgi:UDP-N-acetylglucosamine 2-epimerase (non-hydrolysing)
MRIVNIVGARPNFVKIAPLLREMRRYPEIAPFLVHTGQHYDGRMSACFFTELAIPAPDFNLGVGPGSHAVQTAQVMERLEPVLDSLEPDVVVVVGDVNSTLAAALTAVKLGLPVAHVEAGLRSFDRSMPEEINRLLTDAIADVLFVTEESGQQNLLREGIGPDKIHFVGNVMIDALHTFRPHWEPAAIVDRLGLEAGSPYAAVTLHRPANVDDPSTLANLLDALQAIARHIPIVFPLHPRVQQHLRRQSYLCWSGSDSSPVHRDGIIYLDALGYFDFIGLISRARLVLTDSGGTQDETTVLGVPCLTLRDTTERPVTVTHGTNRVIGTDPQKIVDEVLRVLEHPPVLAGPPPLWDGRAAGRIVEILVERHRGGRRAPAPEPRAAHA